MKSFVVSFHQEDHVDSMQIQKLNEEEFNKAIAGGTRPLFELDTNFGLLLFFDAADEDGAISHMMLQYEEGHEEASACYSFRMEDFYEFMALYLYDMQFSEESEEEDGEGEEEYSPIHHLAHILFHITEEARDIEV